MEDKRILAGEALNDDELEVVDGDVHSEEYSKPVVGQGVALGFTKRES